MTPEQCAEFLGIKINTLYVMKSQGGKGETERIKRIITFAGQSLKGPEGSAVLFKLSDTAKIRIDPAQQNRCRRRAEHRLSPSNAARVAWLSRARRP